MDSKKCLSNSQTCNNSERPKKNEEDAEIANPNTTNSDKESDADDLERIRHLNDIKNYHNKMKIYKLINKFNDKNKDKKGDNASTNNSALENVKDEYLILDNEEIKNKALRYENISDEYGTEPRKRYSSDNLPKLYKSSSPERIILPRFNVKAIKELRMENENMKKAIRKYQDDRDNLNPLLVPFGGRINRIERHYDTNQSPLKGWQRVGDKYHGNTEVFMSPIKHNLGIVVPNIEDERFSGLTWILSMSESTYYDNILLLLSRFRDQYIYGSEEHGHKISDALRSNYMGVTIETVKNWCNIEKLGEGSFGNVYRVQDSNTKEFYAVKHIKPTRDNRIQTILSKFLEYIRERNSLIRVHKNPFIMQFLRSFKFKEIDGLFLVFEYCVSDLHDFLEKLNDSKHQVPKQSFLKKFTKKILRKPTLNEMESMYRNITKQIKYSLHEIIIVYSFELLCGLDFLARCDIVHRDIKPSNIMISRDMHLKIGDLGLVVNKYYTTCKSNDILLQNALTMTTEIDRYKPHGGGTCIYMDPAVALFGFDPDHMNDAYSVALVILEMMFLGERYFYNLRKLDEVQEFVKKTSNREIHKFMMILSRSDLHKMFVRDRIVNTFQNENMKRLGEFVSPLFLPRRQRKTNYLSHKKSTLFQAEFYVAYIDVEKVQKIKPFSALKLTPHNVFTYTFPLETLLSVDLNKEPEIYYDLFGTTHFNPKDRQMLKVEPGLNINLLNLY